MNFDFSVCTEQDRAVFEKLIGSLDRSPDLVIAMEDGRPYLYRWHIVPRNNKGNVYAHVQIASDPARPLHDHPWDNQSVILAGAYFERLSMFPADGEFKALTYKRLAGDTISRKAHHAHRLILPANVSYTMTLFTTGPKIQDWGFWHQGKKLPAEEVTMMVGNASLWTGPNVMEEDHGPYCI